MKKILTVVAMLALTGLSAVAQSWVWERTNTDEYHTYGNSATTDIDGNIYVTGGFYGGHINFGNIILYNADSLTNSDADMYIVKYDPSGNPLWARSAGGTVNEFGSDIGNSIVTDGHGNVYVTGKFRSLHMIFGHDTLTNTAQYLFDYFIVKYDANGTVQWAQKAGGTDEDAGLAMAVDPSGNIYVTGTFKSTFITFGTYTFASYSAPYDDIFLVKYAPSGTVLFARHYGSNGTEGASGLAIDSDYNIYLSGSFDSPTLTFGSYILTRGASSLYDMFVTKTDSAGNVLWAKNAGVGMYNSGTSLCVDNAKNVYVTGYYRGATIIFGNDTLTNTHANNDEIFVVKYKYNGVELWAKTAGGISDDEGNSITTDGDNVYLTGSSASAAITFGSVTLNNYASHDIFVTEYDGSGNTLFAKGVRGFAWDVGNAITLDANHNIYIAGSYMSDTLAFDTDTLFGAIYYTMFLAKLSPLTTDIPNVISHNGTTIYPNPSNGSITIESDITNYTMVVRDIAGRIVFTKTVVNSLGRETLSLPLTTGIYCYEIVSPQGIHANGKIAIIN